MNQEEKLNKQMSSEVVSQPLGLPRGSVRAILTLILTVLVGLGLIIGFDVPEGVYMLWSVAVGYYIGVRSSA